MMRSLSCLLTFVSCLICLAAPAYSASGPSTPLDLTSEPKGVLSPKVQQKLWDAYKTSKACFSPPTYDSGTPHKVPVLDAGYFADTPWTSPFPGTTGAPECATLEHFNLEIPQSMPVIKLDERYSLDARNDLVTDATEWFYRVTTFARLTNDPVAKELLRDAVVTWAKDRSLGKGIHVSWGAKPVDFQMMSMILMVLSATAEVAPDFSSEDRAVVGPWLNDLVKQVGASYWLDRQDNKAYMVALAELLWGLVVGDNRPVQDAIFTYKLAIHDMRPDGSWPVDSQRDQKGLHYDSGATSELVTIAAALMSSRGIDLFSYEVDGRSIHTAVDFVVASIKHPSEMNAKYAIPCPDGGRVNDQGIAKPDMNHLEEAGYLVAYAERFPERESSQFLDLYYRAYPKTIWAERDGGAPQCLFALSGGKFTRKPLTLPTK